MRQLSIATPICVAENFDGEIVALNLDTGLYFSLPGLAGAIWRDLNAGHPPEKIVTELASANDVLGRDAFRFINSLVSHGLLRENGEADSTLPEPEYRTLVECGESDLTFSAHDDLKDLVMTDPIHDVDESAGWPVFRDRA
jgi:hypothetical protein